MFAKIRSRWSARLWMEDLRQAPAPRRWMIGSLRVLVHAVGSFRANLVGIQAAGLTMFTLLALFPLLWLGVGVANLLGFADRMLTRLDELAHEAPANLEEVMAALRSMLERVNQEALELWGSLLLAYTGYALFIKVEQAFNHVWKAHHRSWYKRIGSFVGLLFIVPPLLLAAIIGESVLAQMPLLGAGVRWLPLLGLWLALSCLYKAMPSASVRWIPALIAGGGAALAGAGLHNLYIHAQFGVARYNALYAALAVIPMLLIYLELWWTVVLAGVEVSYALQNLHSLGPRRQVPVLSHRLRRRLALALMQTMASRAALSLQQFTGDVDVPRQWVDAVAQQLELAGLLEIGSDDTARPVAGAAVASAWDVVRAIEGADPGERMPLSAELEGGLADARAALRESLGELGVDSSA